MEENYYKEREVISKPIRILIISFLVLLVFILVFILIKNVNKKEVFNIEKDFLTISKNYYRSNSNELPTVVGDCQNVTLEKLLSKSLIKQTEEYKGCNKYKTRVNVCKLNSGSYQYTPILDCDVLDSEEQYGDWKNGTERDLIADSSDVRFLFLAYKKVETEPGEELEAWKDEIEDTNYEIINSTIYYRYRDKEWLWEETKKEYYTIDDKESSILAYYATKPDSDYINSDSETTAYKWYINKALATSPKKMYSCINPETSATGYKNEPCSNSIDGKTETVKEFYTCGVLKEDASGRHYLEVPEGSKCDCSSEKYGTNCTYEKAYYPSNSKNANQERVYYVEKPVDGAIKDVSTKMNVSRYYKEVTTTTDKYYVNRPSSTAIKVGTGRWGNWSEYATSKPKEYSTREIETREKIKYQLKSNAADNWQKISNSYLTIEEFLTEAQKLNYDVKSLKDIYNNENLKYDLQLQYRNKNN